MSHKISDSCMKWTIPSSIQIIFKAFSLLFLPLPCTCCLCNMKLVVPASFNSMSTRKHAWSLLHYKPLRSTWQWRLKHTYCCCQSLLLPTYNNCEARQTNNHDEHNLLLILVLSLVLLWLFLPQARLSGMRHVIRIEWLLEWMVTQWRIAALIGVQALNYFSQ